MSPARAARNPLLLAIAVALVLLAGCGVQPTTRAHRPYDSYVALGDSYTAAPLVPTTRIDDGCLRSDHDYPALVAGSLHVPHFTDRSCSGATTGALTSRQRPQVAPQLDALASGVDLVTLGIGGNDFGIAGRLFETCTRLRHRDPHGAPCRRAMRVHGRDRLLTKMPAVTARITRALRSVHARAPHARIVVVGYPQIVPSTGRCRALPVATGDYRYARTVNRALDRAVHAAATAVHATWVDVWAASHGHDICADHPWVNGSVNEPGHAAAFHPFGAETRAVAHLVVAALRRG